MANTANNPVAELKELRDQLGLFTAKYKAGDFVPEAEAIRIGTLVERSTELAAAVERGQKSADEMRRAAGESRYEANEDYRGASFNGSKSGYLDTSEAAVKHMLRSGAQKSLVATGSSVARLDLRQEVILKGRETGLGIVNYLRTTERTSSAYRFVRESLVDNQADFVEAGEAKPESDYEVESVDGQLKYLAHISKPIDQDTLDDDSNLENYLVQAMSRGIFEKLGSAAVAAMKTATGRQTIAAGAEPLASVAAGILAVNSLDPYRAGLVILHRTDYLAMVTTRNESGAFDLGLGGALATGATAPADTIYGLPVLLSPAATVGQAIVLDPTAVGISVSPEGGKVKWDESGELFEKNQKRVRVELKSAIDIVKPAGIAIVDLEA